jgi:hypothetical protein
MSNSVDDSLISVSWPVASSVKAFVSTRKGGVSQPPFDGFNLATHVGDDIKAVMTNRQYLASALQTAADGDLAALVWGEQVHGLDVCSLPLVSSQSSAGDDDVSPQADAFYTDVPCQPCLVMTADCLPVFFCNKDGNEVAVAHAGWKGLAAGVLEATVAKFTAPPEQITAWLGPAIGPGKFEVGAEVRAAFCDHPSASTAQREALAAAFSPSAAGKYQADIYALARIRLQGAGLQAIYGGGFCTVSEKDRFFSYRRDGETGRMASIIWFE